MTRATDFNFLKCFESAMMMHLGSMIIVVGGLAAAAAAHADTSTGVSAATVVAAQPERQCAALTDSSALARFETGTTFMLTEKGLVLLKQPEAKKWYSVINNVEPEFPNTGN